MSDRPDAFYGLFSEYLAHCAALGGLPDFHGRACLETKHAIYEFDHGVCFAASRRDKQPHESAGRVMNMRIVGWLEKRGELVTISCDYRPRARAILWRENAWIRKKFTYAITSSSTGFVIGEETAVLQSEPGRPPVRGVQPTLMWPTHDARPVGT